jgi:cytochrome c biogenesis protein CcdA
MGAIVLAAGSAAWLGVLTSISPCPLATNVAAMSYISQRMARPGLVVLAGFLYALGRMIAYTALACLLAASLLTIPQISNTLETYMNKLLGPLLILTGMVLLNLLSLPVTGSRLSERLSHRMAAWGTWGAGALGLLFALSFCPVSAALFFGSLLPLAVKADSRLLIPAVYGAGTAAPVVAVALLMSWSAQSLGKALNRLGRIEKVARAATGIVFVAVGVYYSLAYIFEVSLY